MAAHVNWFRAVFLASAGYGLLFVAARAILPPRAWTRGRTVAGVAADSLKQLLWEAASCVREETKPVQ